MACLQNLPAELIYRIFDSLQQLEDLSAFSLIRTCRICRDVGVNYLVPATTLLKIRKKWRHDHCPCGCDARTSTSVKWTFRDDSLTAEVFEFVKEREGLARMRGNGIAYLRSRYVDILFKHRFSAQEYREKAIDDMKDTTLHGGWWWASGIVIEALKKDIGLDFDGQRWKDVDSLVVESAMEKDESWKKDMTDQLDLNMLVEFAND